MPLMCPERIEAVSRSVVIALGVLVAHGEAQVLPRQQALKPPQLADGTPWIYLGEYDQQRYFLHPAYREEWEAARQDLGAE